LTDFGRAVQSTLDRLPISRSHIRITLEPNLTLRSPCTGFSVTPDRSLFASPVKAGRGILLAVVECAFSQSREALMKKVRAEVEGWPSILLVILILITEERDYHCPTEGTCTWSFFSQCDTSDFELEPVVIKPIVVADHTWCAIKDVEFDVWIREDGAERINLNDSKRVTGYIYPRIEMEEVERVIGKGLSAAKNEICKLANVFGSKSVRRRLQVAELEVEFNWRDIQSGLKISSRATAWSRYETWYFDEFRGIKRAHSDDEEYQPMDNGTPSTSPEP
ncbi:hypothetical protein PISMIDRAFT_108241, partial [Pisolithus microcarpus 441]